ncbi:alcohol dehydrogenase catalytic domain-containing protein [bacterium]|nr:alcohol dehydrogenase catalytic domain-containing protein [bacterium]MCI0605168.1 alcohol dehydrogenase catalytic domain-containing protein [bacterium]
MRAWIYRKEKTDPQGIHIFEGTVADPSPGLNQVLVRVEKVSVCGTDESLFKGELKKVPDGIIPGHEFYGEIVELGREVKHLSTGQRIAGESHYNLPGIADQGIIGLWGPEIRKGELEPPIHGAYSEYLVIPAECAYRVPGELISDHFWPSLFEAIGNDYFLIKRAREMAHPKDLGIFGCGPHGLFAQVFARHMDIHRIAAFEVDSYRQKFASSLEIADQIFDPTVNLEKNVRDFTAGNLFDVTIDMVGKQGQGFEACCKTTKHGGVILLFGLFSGDKFYIDGVSGNEIIFHMKTLRFKYEGKDLTVAGITGREGIWEELIEMVCREKSLQDQLMKPVHVMGTLDQLGENTRHPKPGVLKRAYHAFRS